MCAPSPRYRSSGLPGLRTSGAKPPGAHQPRQPLAAMAEASSRRFSGVGTREAGPRHSPTHAHSGRSVAPLNQRAGSTSGSLFQEKGRSGPAAQGPRGRSGAQRRGVTSGWPDGARPRPDSPDGRVRARGGVHQAPARMHRLPERPAKPNSPDALRRASSRRSLHALSRCGADPPLSCRGRRCSPEVSSTWTK